jgi:DNA polymerase-3 subunit gamma/tau
MATALLGYTDAALLDEVVDAIAAGDGAAVFEIVDRVIEGGHDPRRFVADLLERLRDLVIIAAVPDALDKGLIDAPRDVVERMSAQASVLGAAELSRAADLVNTGLTEMRGATSPRLQLELICARVLLPAAYEDERSLQARLERLERGVAAGVSAGLAGGGTPSAGGAPGVVSGGTAGGPYGSTPGGMSGGTSPGAPQATGPAAARAALGGNRPPAENAAAYAPAQVPAPAHVQAQPQPPATAPAPPAPAVAASPPPAQTPSAQAPPVQAPPAQRPGAWPSTATPGQPRAQEQAQAQAQVQAQAQPQAQPPAPAQPAPQAPQPPQQAPQPQAPAQPAQPAPLGDPSRVRQMWPDILEAVKNRRRLTWMLLFNNAQVAGFDGETLQVGFDNPGARNSFANSGSEDVLKAAISDALGVQWKIEAIVAPNGGGGPSGPNGGYGGGGAPRPAGPQQPPAARSPQNQGHGQGQAQSQGQGQGQNQGARRPDFQAGPPSGPATGFSSGVSSAAYQAAPPPVDEMPPPLEDDMPEDDDPDLVDSALSGHDLFVRELGATVIEEIAHD